MIKYALAVILFFLSLCPEAVASNIYAGMKCDQIVRNYYYQTCYDYNIKGPRYVAYKLRGSKVNSRNILNRPNFRPEKKIPKKYRAYSGDYVYNKFHADRGHLASDASFDYSKNALHSVYSMVNVIPQYYLINRYTWVKAEDYTRSLAVRYGTIYVLDGIEYSKNPPRMGKSQIAYPKAFWKAITNKLGFDICFRYINTSKVDVNTDTLMSHKVSCSTLKIPKNWK